jgi:hypothetical protein
LKLLIFVCDDAVLLQTGFTVFTHGYYSKRRNIFFIIRSSTVQGTMNPNLNLVNPPNFLIHVSVGLAVSMGLRDDENPLAKEDSEQTKEENNSHKEETTKSKEETHLSKEETSNLRKKHIGPSCKLFFR